MVCSVIRATGGARWRHPCTGAPVLVRKLHGGLLTAFPFWPPHGTLGISHSIEAYRDSSVSLLNLARSNEAIRLATELVDQLVRLHLQQAETSHHPETKFSPCGTCRACFRGYTAGLWSRQRAQRSQRTEEAWLQHQGGKHQLWDLKEWYC